MAAAPGTRAASPPKATGGKFPAKPGEKKIGGIPVIYLVVGGVAIVGGYLWIKHQQAQQGQGTGAAKPAARTVAAGPGGNQRFTETIKEWQGHRPKRKHNPGGTNRP